jgi:hypothetical protein
LVALVVAGEFLGVVSIPEPLHHEVELTDGEQEKPVVVEYRHGQLCRARDVAEVRLHIAIGLGAVRVDGGAIDRRWFFFALAAAFLVFGLRIGVFLRCRIDPFEYDFSI